MLRVRTQSIPGKIVAGPLFLAGFGDRSNDEPMTLLKAVARWVLAGVLMVAGVGHFLRLDDFAAQVPPWIPWPTAVVYVSGAIELVLAMAVIVARRSRPTVGWIVAAFFVIVFPGNLWQFIEARDAFGLDTDVARFVRLLFQPVLVVWALWSTDAWRSWRQHHQPGIEVV